MSSKGAFQKSLTHRTAHFENKILAFSQHFPYNSSLPSIPFINRIIWLECGVYSGILLTTVGGRCGQFKQIESALRKYGQPKELTSAIIMTEPFWM